MNIVQTSYIKYTFTKQTVVASRFLSSSAISNQAEFINAPSMRFRPCRSRGGRMKCH